MIVIVFQCFLVMFIWVKISIHEIFEIIIKILDSILKTRHIEIHLSFKRFNPIIPFLKFSIHCNAFWCGGR